MQAKIWANLSQGIRDTDSTLPTSAKWLVFLNMTVDSVWKLVLFLLPGVMTHQIASLSPSALKEVLSLVYVVWIPPSGVFCDFIRNFPVISHWCKIFTECTLYMHRTSFGVWWLRQFFLRHHSSRNFACLEPEDGNIHFSKRCVWKKIQIDGQCSKGSHVHYSTPS